MKIYKKNDCFELYTETYLDCQFIDYLDDANGILTGSHNKETEIGKPYNIRAFRFVGPNRMKNRMEKGEIVIK